MIPLNLQFFGGRGSSGSRSGGGGIKVPKGDSIQERLNNMEDLEGTDSKKNILPMVSKDSAKEITDKVKELRRTRNLSYEDIETDIDKLYTKQNFVDKYELEEIATTSRGAIDGTNTKYDDGIVAVRHQGKLVIIDGNHRVNAAILKKQKTIKIRVIK